MRSMKVEPGAAVILTLMLSDNTVVPPVTAVIAWFMFGETLDLLAIASPYPIYQRAHQQITKKNAEADRELAKVKAEVERMTKRREAIAAQLASLRDVVAGFGENELSIEAKENTLTIKGGKQAKEEQNGEVLYQGIAGRAFERQFQLADYVQVKGASLENGLLHVDLVREIPEAKKPRQVPIGNGQTKAVEAKAA